MFLIFSKRIIGNMVFDYAELICLVLNAGRLCVHVAKEKKGDWLCWQVAGVLQADSKLGRCVICLSSVRLLPLPSVTAYGPLPEGG